MACLCMSWHEWLWWRAVLLSLKHVWRSLEIRRRETWSPVSTVSDPAVVSYFCPLSFHISLSLWYINSSMGVQGSAASAALQQFSRGGQLHEERERKREQGTENECLCLCTCACFATGDAQKKCSVLWYFICGGCVHGRPFEWMR